MCSRGRIIGSIDDLSDADVERLFSLARSNILSGHYFYEQAVLMTAFFEPSTRTRLSFEMASLRLSMRVITFHKETSSLIKGESELHTINNLLALKPDILVIRSKAPFNSANMVQHDTSIINAGDGINEHPTQALTDCFTLMNQWKVDNLRHKTILIIGDVAHSRVANSNIKLMRRLGASILILAPGNLRPQNYLNQVSLIQPFDEIKIGIDAVMCLRIQKERMDEESYPNDREYYYQYGLSMTRFLALGSRVVLLHPGPMNVGVEIDKKVASHPRSLILEQVKNGVLMRASLISFCLR